MRRQSLLRGGMGGLLVCALVFVLAHTAAPSQIRGFPATVLITGGACTNQVMTAISAAGVPTCTTVTSGATTGLATTAGTLAQFAATTSAQLLGVVSDETGSGGLVFGTDPTLTLTNATVPVTTIGALPACGAGTQGQLRVVTDALLPALGTAVGAGGAVKLSVVCVNGTGWVP